MSEEACHGSNQKESVRSTRLWFSPIESAMTSDNTGLVSPRLERRPCRDQPPSSLATTAGTRYVVWGTDGNIGRTWNKTREGVSGVVHPSRTGRAQRGIGLADGYAGVCMYSLLGAMDMPLCPQQCPFSSFSLQLRVDSLFLDELRDSLLDLRVRKTCVMAISPSASQLCAARCQTVPCNDSLFSLPNAAVIVSKSVLGLRESMAGRRTISRIDPGERALGLPQHDGRRGVVLLHDRVGSCEEGPAVRHASASDE